VAAVVVAMIMLRLLSLQVVPWGALVAALVAAPAAAISTTKSRFNGLKFFFKNAPIRGVFPWLFHGLPKR
jgi:hypothetical protein